MTDDHKAMLTDYAVQILNAPPGAPIYVCNALHELIKEARAAINTPPRPRLILLGVIDVEKWREMQEGKSRFIFLRPSSSVTLNNHTRLTPVYAVDSRS